MSDEITINKFDWAALNSLAESIVEVASNLQCSIDRDPQAKTMLEIPHVALRLAHIARQVKEHLKNCTVASEVSHPRDSYELRLKLREITYHAGMDDATDFAVDADIDGGEVLLNAVWSRDNILELLSDETQEEIRSKMLEQRVSAQEDRAV